MDSNQFMQEGQIEEEEDDNDADVSVNNTSDTSSYASDHEHGDLDGEFQRVKKPAKEEIKQMEMIDDFEEPSISSYAKFKTQNEVDMEQIDKFAPKMPELDDLDDILEFGTVQRYIEDGSSSIMLVAPSDPTQIFDLDNIVCFKSKQVIGFILDLIGQINKPLYSVRVYPSFQDKCLAQGVETKNQLLDAKVYLVAKSLKIINTQLPVIMSKKGCDASNIYDEELAENEREFSDDEKEREYKKAKKNKKKKLHNKDRDMEEGELEEQVISKRKNYNNDNNDFKNKKRFNDGKEKFGSQIPMYSTNFSVGQQQQQAQQQQSYQNNFQFQNNQQQYPQYPMYQQQQFQAPMPQMMNYQNPNPLFYGQPFGQNPQQMPQQYPFYQSQMQYPQQQFQQFPNQIPQQIQQIPAFQQQQPPQPGQNQQQQ